MAARREADLYALVKAFLEGQGWRGEGRDRRRDVMAVGGRGGPDCGGTENRFTSPQDGEGAAPDVMFSETARSIACAVLGQAGQLPSRHDRARAAALGLASKKIRSRRIWTPAPISPARKPPAPGGFCAELQRRV